MSASRPGRSPGSLPILAASSTWCWCQAQAPAWRRRSAASSSISISETHLAGASLVGAGLLWRCPMGVVQRYGSGYRAPTSLDAINSLNRCAEIRAVNSTVVCGDGDEPNSQYFVGYVPSNGLLDTGSLLAWDATGLTKVALGFKDNPNAFGEFDMSAEGGSVVVDTATPGASSHSVEFGINDLDEYFWSKAHQPRDSGGELDLVLTVMEGTGIKDAKIKVILKYFRQG